MGHLKTILITFSFGAGAFPSFSNSSNGSQLSKKLPNIVIIYADDMGYGDVGYHGADDILTPNIDKLAQSGVYFTQGYVSISICSPSRCGLLTGVYQQRFTNGQNSRDNDLPWHHLSG